MKLGQKEHGKTVRNASGRTRARILISGKYASLLLIRRRVFRAPFFTNGVSLLRFPAYASRMKKEKARENGNLAMSAIKDAAAGTGKVRSYGLSFLRGTKWSTISLSLKQPSYDIPARALLLLFLLSDPPFRERRRATFVEPGGPLVKIKEIYLRNLSGSRGLSAFCDRVSSSRAFARRTPPPPHHSLSSLRSFRPATPTSPTWHRHRRYSAAENGNIVSLMAFKNLERTILRM